MNFRAFSQHMDILSENKNKSNLSNEYEEQDSYFGTSSYQETSVVSVSEINDSNSHES